MRSGRQTSGFRGVFSSAPFKLLPFQPLDVSEVPEKIQEVPSLGTLCHHKESNGTSKEAKGDR